MTPMVEIADSLQTRNAGAQLLDPFRMVAETRLGKSLRYSALAHPQRQVVLGGNAGRCFGAFERDSKVAAIIAHARRKRQGKCQTVGVTKLFCERNCRVEARHGAIGKTQEPQGPAPIEPRNDARPLPVKEQLGALAIRALERVIDRDGLIRFVQRLGEATKKEQARTEGPVSESAMQRLFMRRSLGRDADGEIVSPLHLATSEIAVPKTAKDRENLVKFALFLTQGLGAAVRLLHLDTRNALRRDERNGNSHLQRKFLLGTCTAVGLRRKRLERLREMGNGFDVR